MFVTRHTMTRLGQGAATFGMRLNDEPLSRQELIRQYTAGLQGRLRCEDLKQIKKWLFALGALIDQGISDEPSKLALLHALGDLRCIRQETVNGHLEENPKITQLTVQVGQALAAHAVQNNILCKAFNRHFGIQSAWL